MEDEDCQECFEDDMKCCDGEEDCYHCGEESCGDDGSGC